MTSDGQNGGNQTGSKLNKCFVCLNKENDWLMFTVIAQYNEATIS